MSYSKTSTFKSFNDLCDVASVVIFCASDNTMMLVIEQGTNEYWIPSVKVPKGTSSIQSISKDLLQGTFGVEVPLNQLLRFNKFWIPPGHKVPYITHLVFEVRVGVEMKRKFKNPVEKDKCKICWSSIDEIKKFHVNNFLKSPEIVEFTSLVCNKPIPRRPSGYTIIDNFIEITDDVMVTNETNTYDQLVDASGIDRAAQETLYKEFLLMCFPSLYLSLQMFAKFVVEIGWPKHEASDLYRAADIYNRGGISFREFLYFLAATEPETTHGGIVAELRCRYIFKYLDYDKNNLLQQDEIKNFVVLVRRTNEEILEPIKIGMEVKECYKAMGVSETHPVTMSEFLQAVAELKLRGTCHIFRAPSSIKNYTRDLMVRNSKIIPRNHGDYFKATEGYEVASHCLKLKKNGGEIEIQPYWNIDGFGATSSTCKEQSGNELLRTISLDKFDQKSKSNELLKALRYLIQTNKATLPHCYMKLMHLKFRWGNLDAATMANYITTVCNDLKEIFKEEPRLLHIPSPVYIMGDLHGNIADLLEFEQTFWPIGPSLCPCHLLFLGDYVDRGVFSLEVISYLFAYKLQSPGKIFLLRGNHEVMRVQRQWTFEKECLIKFGDKLGPKVFKSINEVFNTLPLAAVVDERVFCCHGGIPPPWLCPVAAAINDIPRVLTDPRDESDLAWELMWNDPIRATLLTEETARELLANEGFVENSKRGTGHCFSFEALDKFLKANRFTHLVRGHETAEAGFFLQQQRHLFTVFSSSRYCGHENPAACILATEGKLRVLRLEFE